MVLHVVPKKSRFADEIGEHYRVINSPPTCVGRVNVIEVIYYIHGPMED